MRTPLLLIPGSLTVALTLGAGCVPPGQQTTPQGIVDGNVGIDPSAYPGQHVQGEPDNSFNQPIEVIFDSTGVAHLQGTIATSSDVDVYSLGTLQAGDRLIVDVGHPSGSLDSVAAVFDEGGRLMFTNDDRDASLNQLDPLINFIVHEDTTTSFLGISASGLADPSSTIGPYDITVTLVTGGTAPTAQGQIIVLDFNGGTVDIPGDATYTVGPFNTGEISSSYAGMTAAVEQQIVTQIQTDYQGLNLTVQTVPGSTPPAGCTASTIFFGGHNADAYGTSQEVDPYNANHCDDSIIFTDEFVPSRFGRVLSPTELGTAIGHVTSHEIGHLLGLNHVDNIHDLMDTTGAAPTFLGVQQFITSPLDPTIFPIGTQDGAMLLQETIGIK